jgi:enoyl-CoA hydratase
MISHIFDDAAYDDELEAVLPALADGPTASYHWITRTLAAVTLSALPTAQAMEAEGQIELTPTDYFRRRVREFRARRRPK